MRRLILPVLMVVALLFPLTALADSITPSTFDATLAVGESVTISKTVTITKEVTSAKVDVFFLTDTTGSMGGLIGSVRTSASAILSSVSALGDVAFGVGEYKDFGGYDPYAYRLNTAITTNTTAVQNGINMYSASGGGDGPEANLYALNEIATSALTGWRADSTRVLVWFGDYYGHDPSGGVTEALATTALVDNDIVVQAISTGSSFDATGQATRIAAATGGTYYPTINTSSIVSEITSAVTSVFDDYSTVTLAVAGAPGVDVTWAPSSITGTFDRSVDRTFDFSVTFEGVTPGTYDFALNALVDKGLVATELDHIVVGDGGGTAPVPEPSTVLLLGLGLGGLAFIRRRRKNG